MLAQRIRVQHTLYNNNIWYWYSRQYIIIQAQLLLLQERNVPQALSSEEGLGKIVKTYSTSYKKYHKWHSGSFALLKRLNFTQQSLDLLYCTFPYFCVDLDSVPAQIAIKHHNSFAIISNFSYWFNQLIS